MLSRCFRGDRAVLSRQNSPLSGRAPRARRWDVRALHDQPFEGLGFQLSKKVIAHLGERRRIVAKIAAKICKNFCLSWGQGERSRKGAEAQRITKEESGKYIARSEGVPGPSSSSDGP